MNPGNLYCYLLSSLQFLQLTLLYYYTGGMLLRTVCASHTMFLGIAKMLDVKGALSLLLSSSLAPYVWSSLQQLNNDLEVVEWPGFKWYKVSQLVCLYVQTMYVKSLT